MCVVCVQEIAGYQRELADPSTSEERRAELEELVQVNEGIIQINKQRLVSTEAELASTAAALLHQGNSHDDITVMNIIKTRPMAFQSISWQRALSLCLADHS